MKYLQYRCHLRPSKYVYSTRHGFQCFKKLGVRVKPYYKSVQSRSVNCVVSGIYYLLTSSNYWGGSIKRALCPRGITVKTRNFSGLANVCSIRTQKLFFFLTGDAKRPSLYLSFDQHLWVRQKACLQWLTRLYSTPAGFGFIRRHQTCFKTLLLEVILIDLQ